jgi:hypothetical protein
MQELRAPILAGFAMLLAFAGCNNSQPAATPPPAAIPMASTPPVNPVLEVLQTAEDKKDEVRTAGLTQGSVVTWTSTTTQFSVQFDSKKMNPCDPKGTSVSPTSSFTYLSTTTSPYTATCTIVDTNSLPSGKVPYRYQVYAVPPGIPYIHTNSHCEGCVIDMSGL